MNEQTHDSTKLPNEPADGAWTGAYDALRRLAAGYMRGERKDHTLDPTALVNEAYVRLASMRTRMPIDQLEFIALASHKMRQVLVDHARKSRSQKRGDQWERRTLEEGLLVAPRSGIDIIAIDDAIRSLAAEHPEAAQVVELRFFMGLSAAEIARMNGVSRQVIERRWQFGRAWLSRALKAEARQPDA